MTRQSFFKSKNVKSLLSNYFIFIILIVLVIFLGIVKTEAFLSLNNLKNLIRQVAIIGILAYGVAFTILTAGIDLSGGSVIALTSCSVGFFVQQTETGGSALPLAVAIMLTMIIGGFCGLINGVVISYGHVPPFIATLATGLFAEGTVLIVTDGLPVSGYIESFKYIGNGYFIGIPIPAIIFIVITVIVHLLLHKTKFGSYVFAIGGNEIAAAVSGINVERIKTLVYVLSGVMASCAGMLLAARTGTALPSYGDGYDLDAITCAIIGGTSFSGGKGNIPGILCGILIVGILVNGMTMMQISSYWQTIVKGMVILVAVLLDQGRGHRK